MNDVKQLERMMGARIALVRDKVFFGIISMRMGLIDDPNLKHLAGTDGVSIWFNPDKIQSCTREQLIGLIAHEAAHIMLCHHLRRGTRDQKKWNIACDYAINIILCDEGFSLPSGGFLDQKYRGMSAEEIYLLLPDQADQPEFDFVKDWSGKGQEGAKGSSPSEAQIKVEEGMVKAAVANAMAMARKRGQVSAGMERMVQALCEPKAPWSDILFNILTQTAETDHSWAKPNKRMLHQYGIITPTLDGYKVGNIGIINDVSGSTSEYQEQFASEISDILSQYECQVVVLNHDTVTTSIEEYSQDDLPLTLKTKGYGGTSADSTYALAEDEYNFDILIHLTDGEMDWSKIPEPGCRVVIACCSPYYSKRLPKWAEVVEIY